MKVRLASFPMIYTCWGCAYHLRTQKIKRFRAALFPWGNCAAAKANNISESNASSWERPQKEETYDKRNYSMNFLIKNYFFWYIYIPQLLLLLRDSVEQNIEVLRTVFTIRTWTCVCYIRMRMAYGEVLQI